MTLAPGTLLGGYRIEAVAGRGGMGVVYRAVQVGLDRPVALKLIAPEFARDPEFRARFVRESRLAASLDHPHVIPVYEAGEADGSLFIAMRWVDGPDLRERIAVEGALTPAQAAAIAVQVAGALDAAHARGLVHRDVKPANVLLAGDPDEPHAYLSDFGLARSEASSDRLTRTGGAIGTAAYSSPEQIEGGAVDGRADVYALACVLFFALTGAPPFRRDTELATAWAQVHEPPPSARAARPAVSSALDAVVAGGLAKRATDRPASAGAFAREALDAATAPGGSTESEGRVRGDRNRAGHVGGSDADEAGPLPPAESVRTRHLGGAPRPGADAPTVRLERSGRRRRRALAWLAALVALGVGAAVIVVLATGDGGGEGERSGRPTKDAPAQPSPTPGPAEPSADGGVVRCAGGSCRQDGNAVTEPIEDEPCGGGSATWGRLDGGASEAALSACLGEPAAVPERVPAIAGARLDRAEEYLDERAVAHETEGGGTFGVVVPENWTVCDTDPAVGTPLDAPSLTLVISRSC